MTKSGDELLRECAEEGALVKPTIVLIGVGHVFDLRDNVRAVIRDVQPQTVALELDSARFYGLISADRRDKGGQPILYQLLGRFQQSMAEQYDSEVGSEMLAAASAAREVGADIALIDMDALAMLSRLRRFMPLKEKVLMIIGAFLAVFTRRKKVERELKRYTENEEGFMNEIRRAYPSVVKILIDERDRFMVDRLREISRKSDVTVAIVGDGHVTGMTKLVSEFANVKVWRLDRLRETSAMSGNDQMTFSFMLESDDSKA